MKCRSCDCILSDEEATRKYNGTLVYYELCNYCFNEVYSYEEEEILVPLEEDEDV